MHSMTVECRTRGCVGGGTPRRVWLQLVALGVLAVPQFLCQHCGAELARVDAPEPVVAPAKNGRKR